MIDNKYIKNLFSRIKKRSPKILVIGDIMLDSYVFGSVERISPEAPVPIINFVSKQNTLGGSGNVAHNLKNLGVNVSILSMVGDDNEGALTRDLLRKIGINSDGIYIKKNSNTTNKTRFISGNSQLLRLDRDSTDKPNYEKVMNYLKDNIRSYDSIIISDYDKGYCSSQLVQSVIKETKKLDISVFIDPKGETWEKYSNSFCITPNIKEAELILKTSLENDSDFENAARVICEKYKIKSCLITRGSDGMTFFNGHRTIHQKVSEKEVFDVSGAGDTVISYFCASFSLGLNIDDCLKISSEVSSEVVTHVGTTPFNFKFFKNDS